MSGRWRRVTVAAAALVICLPAWAQVPMNLFVVPVVVKAKGSAGTDWKTDLFVSNLGAAEAQISAHFFKENQTNSFNGTFAKAGMAVAPGQTLLVTDLVGAWFPAAGTSTKGWLLLADTTPVPDCENPPDAAKLAVSVRIYNAANPAATYGQVAAIEMVYINPSTYPSVITGVRHQGKNAKPGMRTNAGVANLSTVPINVLVRVYRANGTLAGEAQKQVQALSLQQWDVESTLKIPLLDSGGGRLEGSLVPGAPLDYCALQETPPACADPCDPEACPNKFELPAVPAFIAYASNVENTTGDGEHLTSVTDLISYYADIGAYLDEHCPEEEESGSALASQYARRWGLSREEVVPTLKKVTGRPAPGASK